MRDDIRDVKPTMDMEKKIFLNEQTEHKFYIIFLISQMT